MDTRNYFKSQCSRVPFMLKFKYKYTIALFPSPSWMWDSRCKNYSKYMGYWSTFNADNSAIIHRILTKKMSFKRYGHGHYIVKIERMDYV